MLKVGDIVVLKSLTELAGCAGMVPYMFKYCGQAVTVKSISELSFSGVYTFQIEEDDFSFSSTWIEKDLEFKELAHLHLVHTLRMKVKEAGEALERTKNILHSQGDMRAFRPGASMSSYDWSNVTNWGKI